MIRIKADGTKVSSEIVSDEKKIKAKCPKCGCVYYSITDFNSYWDDSNRGLFCNECGTDLEDQIF